MADNRPLCFDHLQFLCWISYPFMGFLRISPILNIDHNCSSTPPEIAEMIFYGGSYVTYEKKLLIMLPNESLSFYET